MNWVALYALLSKKIESVTGLHNEVVAQLPASGVEGTLYFVPKGTPGTSDIYDEYIWTDGDPTGSFEKLGSTEIDLSGYLTSSDVAAVALSGDYTDLENKPDLSGYLTSSDVANVAISGSYNDLSDTPTIPEGWTDINGTLSAGSTSLILTSNKITTDSIIDIYTDVFGVDPTDMVVATGSITLTFEAQQSDVHVKARINKEPDQVSGNADLAINPTITVTEVSE